MYENVVDFAEWYYKKGCPQKILSDLTVYRTDSASSTCVYRDGRYQVEVYLIDPKAPVPKHQHPGVDAVEIDQSAVQLLKDASQIRPELERSVLYKGQWHGNGIRDRAKHSGYYLTSCQYWHHGIPITTISGRWVGETVGPKHDNLIRVLNPDSYVIEGYADVTRSATEVEIL